MHVLEHQQSGHQPCWQWWLPRPHATDRTEASGQELPIDLRRQTDQRMAKVDDLLQAGPKQIILTIVAWLADALLQQRIRRQRNYEPPKSAFVKRKKTETHPRLSCKIQYLLSSNYSDASIASKFFTGDEIAEIFPEDMSSMTLGREPLDWYFQLGDKVTERVVVRHIFGNVEGADITKD